MFEKHYLVKREQYDDLIREAEKARLVREIKNSHQDVSRISDRDSRVKSAGLFERLAVLFRNARAIPGS